MPAGLDAVLFGAAWGPLVLLGVAAAALLAVLSRPATGRSPHLESLVHVFFGGLTAMVGLASLLLLVRVAGVALGFLETPLGPGLGVVVLANAVVEAIAYMVFCAPMLRMRAPEPTPSVAAVSTWAPGNDHDPAVRAALEAHGLGRDR